MRARSTRTRTSFLAVLAGTLALSCRIDTDPSAFQAPECVAKSTDGQEMRCPAPDESFTGDQCKCVELVTRNEYWGRVVNGR